MEFDIREKVFEVVNLAMFGQNYREKIDKIEAEFNRLQAIENNLLNKQDECQQEAE